MVLFTPNINIVSEIRDAVVLNLSSYYSGFTNINSLINQAFRLTNGLGGSQLIDCISSPMFDQQYANIILSEDNSFMELMKIMIPSYEGSTVVVLIEHDELRDAVTEALIKLIQVRYGYNCWIVEDFDDLNSIDISKEYFTPMGITALDADRFRYQNLMLPKY